MVADVAVVTGVVVTVKVALVAPPLTVTLAGTDTAAELSDSDTTMPPAGAAAVKVTVPVADSPPTTVAGLTDRAETDAGAGGGLTVSVAERVPPLRVPVMVAFVGVATAVVEI